MKARIIAQYYADAGSFVTREQNRYSLDTVRLERHPERGIVIVATDGHTMGVFHDLSGECPEDGITLRFDESLAGLCVPEVVMEINDDGAACLLRGTKEFARFADVESDGKFPSWRAILPKWTREAKRTDYNPEYIERCAKIIRGHYPHLAIWSGALLPLVTHADEGPSVVRSYERDDCFFLIMPMRQSDDTRWPDLIDALRPPDTPTETKAAE